MREPLEGPQTPEAGQYVDCFAPPGYDRLDHPWYPAAVTIFILFLICVVTALVLSYGCDLIYRYTGCCRVCRHRAAANPAPGTPRRPDNQRWAFNSATGVFTREEDDSEQDTPEEERRIGAFTLRSRRELDRAVGAAPKSRGLRNRRSSPPRGLSSAAAASSSLGSTGAPLEPRTDAEDIIRGQQQSGTDAPRRRGPPSRSQIEQHTDVFGCSCNTDGQGEEHRRIVDLKRRTTPTSEGVFRLTTRGGWSSAVTTRTHSGGDPDSLGVTESNAGSGGQLLPGALLSSADMHECFSKALEEAERRVVEYSKLPEWGASENERYARRRDPPPQI